METPQNKDQVISSFKNGIDTLENVLAGLSETEMDYEPVNKGWTIRQIVHHIADGDDLWKTAIKMALGNENSEFTLKWYLQLPQTDWANKWCYDKRSIDISLSILKANRNYILQLIEYAPDPWNKSVNFIEPDGKIEKVPVGLIVKMQSDHLEHHVKRILEIRKEFAA